MEKIKRVKVKDFSENEVPLVPYSEDVMGDGHETTVRNFMKLYAREYPEADEAMEDGVHSFEECWKYVTDWARKKAKNGCAALSSDTVFRLAANYFLSPVVEEEKEEDECEKLPFEPDDEDEIEDLIPQLHEILDSVNDAKDDVEALIKKLEGNA